MQSSPFIEEAVKEFEEKFYVKERSGIFSKMMDEKIADFLRSKLTLALEEGKIKGRTDEAETCERHNKKQFAAGRKAAVEYIKKNSVPVKTDYSNGFVVSDSILEQALQASNGE